jgi:predicted nuclease of predicted toxin-antitoxin system
VQLLIDEHLSPRLVQWAAALGVFALSVPHAGLAGKTDPFLWSYALDPGFTVVTTNARDFIHLLDVELHAGLIVLRRSALSRDEQWERLEPVVRHVMATGDADFMVNRVIDVWEPGCFDVRNMPSR